MLGPMTEFLAFSEITILIRLIVIIYFSLKWLAFEIFEVQTRQIYFGKHAKTLTPQASAVISIN